MDEQTESRILMKVGELDGKIEGIQIAQDKICEEISELRKDITGFKIKAYGIGGVLGGITGFLTKFLS